jgi:hypothetical protein
MYKIGDKVIGLEGIGVILKVDNIGVLVHWESNYTIWMSTSAVRLYTPLEELL